jgi:hypothetical protein
MMYLIFIAFFLVLCLLIAAYADSVCDAWRDGKDPLKSHFTEEFYYNKEKVYANDGLPWHSDFWHNAKLVREWAWCFAIASGLAIMSPWWFFSAPVFAFIKGKAFYFFLHNVFGN